MKKFYLTNNDYWIGGVCGGISAYTGIDVLLIRLLFLFLIFTKFPIIFIYFIFWFLAPIK